MDKNEIALQITLKAMETGMISKTIMGNAVAKEQKEKANEFNAIELAKFYRSVLKDLNI